MAKNLLKAISLVAILFHLAACETTREVSTTNVGGRVSNISESNFNKQKAAANRVNSGLTYLNHNNFERAKFHLDKALEYDPDSGNVQYALGIYYQRVHDLKQSQIHFNNALNSEPKNPRYLNAYGAFLCEKGDYKKADKLFHQAIDIPTYTDIAYAYFNVGFCAVKQNDTDKAEEYFRKALNHNRSMPSALIEMAKIEFSKKRYERTLSYVKRYEREGQTTAESAWLALRAAHYERKKDEIARYSLILEEKFPDSDETASFLDDKKRWM